MADSRPTAAGPPTHGSESRLRVEPSRKHGPFDPRYPPARHAPPPESLRRPGEGRLDWRAFHARFFPESRRHDSDALAAYESYADDVESRPAAPRRSGIALGEPPAQLLTAPAGA